MKKETLTKLKEYVKKLDDIDERIAEAKWNLEYLMGFNSDQKAMGYYEVDGEPYRPAGPWGWVEEVWPGGIIAMKEDRKKARGKLGGLIRQQKRLLQEGAFGNI